MKTMLRSIAQLIFVAAAFSCTAPTQQQTEVVADAPVAGQSAVQDDESQKNIVQTAVASPDHKTLVAALKAASYVDALSNAGPFTVFAPNDAAFNKLPEGTVDDLVKPENKLKLQDILEYHVYVGVIRENMIQDGMTLNQVNGKNVKLEKKGDDIFVNGAKVLGTAQTSNGIIYIIDTVLIPQ
jgi:uncharacterized surface protein with fasciclin (FAS1) repeats